MLIECFVNLQQRTRTESQVQKMTNSYVVSIPDHPSLCAVPLYRGPRQDALEPSSFSNCNEEILNL